MKAIKLFLLKVWAIVSAIKPEEAIVSQPQPKSKPPITISKFIGLRPAPGILQVDSMEEVFKKLDHEGFFEALKQDIKGMQSQRRKNNSSKSIFSLTDAEFAKYHQEVAKKVVRLKLESGGKE